MKILIFGNHTCANRGDAAIARGTIDLMKSLYPQCDIDLMSRFPVSSELLLNRPAIQDPFYTFYNSKKTYVKRKITNLLKKYYAYLFQKKIQSQGLYTLLPIIKPYKEFSLIAQDYDIYIQVGGSFFVDLYGPQQFDAALCLIYIKQNVYFFGHSLGPFEGDAYRNLSYFVLNRVNNVWVREIESLNHIKKLGVDSNQIKSCIDCAFLVDPNQYKITNKIESLVNSINRPIIAITARSLAPFDKRLGITQNQYENAFASTCLRLIEKGYAIVAVSTCTSICHYNRDDRLVAHNIGKVIKDNPFYHVILDELNDIELGQFFSRCKLVIGTRLHSTIISMTFGTPAIAIYYEHKSQGVFRDIRIPELSFKIQDMNIPQYNETIDLILDEDSDLFKQTTTNISTYISNGKSQLSAMLHEAEAHHELNVLDNS